MTAQELRIGNKLRRQSNGNYCTVNWGIIKEAEMGELRDYEPIPLTPEILEKAGAVCFVRRDWQLDGEHIIDFEQVESGGFRLRAEEFEYYGAEFHHLHQLQNLYYALTGEELAIDL